MTTSLSESMKEQSANQKFMEKKSFVDRLLPFQGHWFRMAKSILYQEDLCRDVIQDLYLKLWEKHHELDQIANLSAYSLRILRNLCIDHLRKTVVTEEINADVITQILSPYESYEKKEIRKFISKLIDQLPELQRTIIRLRDVEGFEFKEISEIVSISENAVKVNLSRARQKIRERLLSLNVKNN